MVLWNYLSKSILSNDETEKELADECLIKACKYCKFRLDWAFWTPEEKSQQDKYRTSAHNAFMDAANIYLRYLARINPTDKEYNELAEKLKVMDRKSFGDIACDIAYRISLQER